MLDAVHHWAVENDYDAVRGECFNRQRAMLHLALTNEYDVIGMRWDADHSDNLLLLEKALAG